jgi:type I restriction enzyme, S subunit
MQSVNSDEETLPNGWITLQLLELFFYPTNDIVDGPFGSNLKTSDYTDSGVPILRIQNIERNGGSKSKLWGTPPLA